MKVWVQRHGEAGEFNHSDPVAEYQRRLTNEGRFDVERMGRALMERGENLSRIIASPLHRTAETAAIMGGLLGVPVDYAMQLEPHLDLVEWLKDLTSDEAFARVMIVGHTDNLHPALASLARLDGGKMHKGEVRKFRVKGGLWTEKWRLAPGDLKSRRVLKLGTSAQY